MFKTIAFAAIGAFIATTTPALAGPGLVLQGKSQNGIALRTAGLPSDALHIANQPQLPPAPKLPAFDAELAGKPVQTACTNCGVKFNGAKHNGLTLNGLTLNGLTLNGAGLNGWSLNGKLFNGTKTGAPTAEREARFDVRAVTLPGGKRIVVR